MRYKNIRLTAALLSALTAFSLTACNGVGGTSGSSTQESDTQSSTDDSAVSLADGNSDSESTPGGDASSDDTSSAAEHIYVKDGKFSLPEETLTFDMPEGWKLSDEVSIVYVFESENTDNTFNLTVSKPNSNIQDLTAEEMTKTYAVTLETFTLITFEHVVISGKPAVYMQLTGKLSQTEREMTLYQYMIQSGSKAYCFTFTQKNSDGSFKTEIIDKIIGAADDSGNYNGSLTIK